MKMRLIIFAFIILGAMLVSGCNAPSGAGNVQKTADGKIMCSDMNCFAQYFSSCTPAEVILPSENQNATIIIHGFENETCHYTMAFGSMTVADCHFKKEDLTMNVLGQMFGNKLGQDAIVAAACK